MDTVVAGVRVCHAPAELTPVEPPKDDAVGDGRPDGGKGSCVVSATRTVLGEGLTVCREGDVVMGAEIVDGDVGRTTAGTATNSGVVVVVAGFSPSAGEPLCNGDE